MSVRDSNITEASQRNEAATQSVPQYSGASGSHTENACPQTPISFSREAKLDFHSSTTSNATIDFWGDEWSNTAEITPITPPTIGTSVKSAVPATPESPSARKAEAQTNLSPDALRASSVQARGKEPEIKAEEDDDIKPIKFRNLTLPLREVNEIIYPADRKKIQEDFTVPVQPEYDFSQLRPKLHKQTRTLTQTKFQRRKGDLASFRVEEDSKIKLEQTSSSYGSAAKVTTTIEKQTVTTTEPLSQILEHIIPSNVRQRLSEDKTRCIASFITKSSDRKIGDRCRWNAKESRNPEAPGHVKRYLEALAKCHKERDYADFLDHIGGLMQYTLCGNHYNSAAGDRIGKLEGFIQNIMAAKSSSQDSPSDVDIVAFRMWAGALSNQKRLSITQHTSGVKQEVYPGTSSTPTGLDSRTTHVKSRTTVSTGNQSASITSTTTGSSTTITFRLNGNHWQPYRPNSTRSRPVSDVLQEVVEQKLGSLSLKRGFIYIFWLKGVFGYVKIGFAADPEKRLKGWNKGCKETYEFHEASYKNELIEVPHVHRVERLIHTELKDARMQMKCKGCDKTHREWFQVTEAHAIKVFQKWKDWILQHPYEEDEFGEWKLKPSFRSQLHKVCQPLQLETQPDAKTLPGKAKRPNLSAGKQRRKSKEPSKPRQERKSNFFK
ncbi:DUF1766-domain-containing protein [Zopfia rhizophila CBS 207.26]|uniref:DUF1766-domain-containing protein n=1 Tax=Zopfia rhizophila CBS 207.26 TaxID=1314779 RepID=A0A6A6ELJ5_9PEZI|nr:DUF1766-domain-containing protein [Zopfia rhizophila CBS 207.26]